MDLNKEWLYWASRPFYSQELRIDLNIKAANNQTSQRSTLVGFELVSRSLAMCARCPRRTACLLACLPHPDVIKPVAASLLASL